MTPLENKQLVESVFAALAYGNGKPFVDLMADDVCWTFPYSESSTRWSISYRGKQSVRRDLLDPLFAQFDGPYTSTASRIIAEGDWVVVQSKGQALTRKGERYDNDYCYVLRLSAGKVREIIEYCDTGLLNRVLDDPDSA
jgi:uncharacterized protein